MILLLQFAVSDIVTGTAGSVRGGRAAPPGLSHLPRRDAEPYTHWTNVVTHCTHCAAMHCTLCEDVALSGETQPDDYCGVTRFTLNMHNWTLNQAMLHYFSEHFGTGVLWFSLVAIIE